MPNYCHNDIEILGNSEDIKKLRELVGDNFDFNKIIPMPEELEDDNYRRLTKEQQEIVQKKYGYKDWYQWRIANWDVKWPACEVQSDWDDDFAEISFDTPWCPPEKIYNKLRELFPNISISWMYNEPGIGFAGYL
jgi:hypothetical protein